MDEEVERLKYFSKKALCIKNEKEFTFIDSSWMFNHNGFYAAANR
jgi:hypothetical protein